MRAHSPVPQRTPTRPNSSRAGTERAPRSAERATLVVWVENAGGGAAMWCETPRSDAVVRLLEFSGCSIPTRAAGLNRLGFFREISSLSRDHSTESLYFGLMTASTDESAEEARKALQSTAKEHTYNAIDGRVRRWGRNCDRALHRPRILLRRAARRSDAVGAAVVGTVSPHVHANRAAALRRPLVSLSPRGTALRSRS